MNDRSNKVSDAVTCQLYRCQWSAAAGLAALNRDVQLCKNTAPVMVAPLNGQAAFDIVPPTGQRRGCKYFSREP